MLLPHELLRAAAAIVDFLLNSPSTRPFRAARASLAATVAASEGDKLIERWLSACTVAERDGTDCGVTH